MRQRMLLFITRFLLIILIGQSHRGCKFTVKKQGCAEFEEIVYISIFPFYVIYCVSFVREQ